MKKSLKRKIQFVLFWGILIVSFLFFASLLILIANGYHLDYRNFKLSKTAMIVINGSTEPLDVTLNGKTKETYLPVKYTQLFPGSYYLSINKSGFYGFQKTFQLTGGQAYVISNLTLIKQDPQITNLVNNDKTLSKIKTGNSSQSTGFIVSDNEIRSGNVLVTRFSQPVISAIYDSSTSRYFVQLSDGIHTIGDDGSNDNLIIKLDKNTPAIMSINDNLLSFIIGEQIFQAQLW